MQWFFSLLTGLAVGIIFSLLKFPIPAPNNLSGILGIVGIFLGMLVIQHFK
jgi:XapX domain-containing protein